MINFDFEYLKSLLSRETYSVLKFCQQLNVRSKNDDLQKSEMQLTEAFSLVQHHQGITGTSRQHVANDYAKKLYKGRESCFESSKEEISKLFEINQDFATCDFLNVTICDLTEPGFYFGATVLLLDNLRPMKTSERIRMNSPLAYTQHRP